MKLNEVFSKEYLKGLKQGLEVAKDVAKRQGYEIIFPDIEEMKIFKDKKKTKKCTICGEKIPNKSKDELIRLGYSGCYDYLMKKSYIFCKKHSVKEKVKFFMEDKEKTKK